MVPTLGRNLPAGTRPGASRGYSFSLSPQSHLGIGKHRLLDFLPLDGDGA